MIKVILDTNFLVYCAENKIDYASEIMNIMSEGYELAVPAQVVKELEKISKAAEKLSDRNAALLALKLLKHNNVFVENSFGKYADNAILRMAEGNIVATHDAELKKKLKKSKKIVIFGKKKLVLG